jgi:PRTRC genetic system protein B
MKFKLDSEARSYKVQSAILLYGSDRTNEAPQFSFASIHDVKNVGSAGEPRLAIMAGSPTTKEALIQALGSLADEYAITTDIIPTQVLSFSQLHLMWWVPAAKRHVYFKSNGVGRVSKVVAHPPLVFYVAKAGWRVFALKANKRPTGTTKLFQAPYFNLYEDGSVCVGSAAIPPNCTIASISQWEEAFFKSEFTHINDVHVKRTNDPKSDTAFWKDYLESDLDKFPPNMLVPYGDCVGALLSPLKEATR